MGNLGAYQTMTTLAKKVGGPIQLLVGAGLGGYAAGRTVEAAVKKVVRSTKAMIEKRSAPCPTMGMRFEVLSDGEDDSGLKLHTGDEYQVVECDGESILIEILGDPDSPYFVSSSFLSTVSGFPAAEPPRDA